MSGRTLALTVLCVSLLAIGQLLFKMAATQWRVDAGAWSAAKDLFSARMILALFIYGFATVLWVYILRTAPLSSAYLVFSLAFLIVPVLAHFAFDEPIGANTLVGGVLIIAGIVVAAR